jgi:hypothetical protein
MLRPLSFAGCVVDLSDAAILLCLVVDLSGAPILLCLVVDLSDAAVLLCLVFAGHSVLMVPSGGQGPRVILVRFLVIFLRIFVIFLLDSNTAGSLRFWLMHSDSTHRCINHCIRHCIHRPVCWATRGGVALVGAGHAR